MRWQCHATVIPALPGLLNNGVLIDESRGGSINNGSPQPVSVNIDPGGLYGAVPSSLLAAAQGFGTVPAGTTISVYSSDNQTLLYSYTTTAANGPIVVSGRLMNTGHIPFLLSPVYIGYRPRRSRDDNIR